VTFATEYVALFESALDMLDHMYYEVDTDAEYRMEPAREQVGQTVVGTHSVSVT
jgi:hypothetical protein